MNAMRLSVLCLLTALSVAARAEFIHPELLSFETSTAPAESTDGTLSLNAEHYKHGSHSLQWTWDKAGATWSIHAPVAYEKVKTRYSHDNSIYTFVFWVYSFEPIDGSMRVEFLKQGRVCCWFDYGLNFRGWRGGWLGFRRDMQGKPEEGMDQMRITAPRGVGHGRLLFDHLILSSLQDSRQHTADLQAPYINPNTTNHWLVLLRSWNLEFDMPLSPYTEREQKDVQTISRRLDKMLIGGRVPSADSLQRAFDSYHISRNADGTLQGLPVFFERYGETYEHMGMTVDYTTMIGASGLARANRLLLDMAQAYRQGQSDEERRQVAGMFCLLTEHLFDQGFEAGSAMGTLHHLGYSMRNFFPAMHLMRDVLDEAGLRSRAQQAVEWFSGTGEVKRAPEVLGMDMDAFNTNLLGRLESILLMDEGPRQVRYLRCYSRWFDNGLQPSDGLSGSFKIDGTAFHHCNHYPAYAIGGMRGAADGLWLLHGTTFRASEQGHESLKRAVLSMRLYCNLLNWPLSLSGRHPDGRGSLQPATFARLAECGTPDGSEAVDKEVVRAYLRLTSDKPTRKFQNLGLSPEPDPQGSWAFPYSCLNVHRRGSWMVSVKGHSRYIWNTETYRGANLYGRYLNYGNLQILSGGHPISNEGSGFHHDGWDWNHFPGTTTTVLPISQLRADIGNLGDDSGYEEMLQSDESFCNGITLDGNGAWGMKLHSHDKYDGSLRARKSVFFHDSIVVCLGSDIESRLDAPTVTTLFQDHVTSIDGCATFTMDTAKTFTIRPAGGKEVVRLNDQQGNAYYIVEGKEVKSSLGRQHSFSQKTDAPTEGYFEKVWIDHGHQPHGASYEYMIHIGGKGQSLGQGSPYAVNRCDSQAHVVTFGSDKLICYVLFEPNAAMNNSAPCLVMTRQEGKRLTMAVSDPDLHLYEGPSDETYDANGRRKERIIYSYAWKDSPSRPSTVTLTIDGRWKLAKPNDNVTLTPQGRQTQLTINCQHGLAREFTLVER